MAERFSPLPELLIFKELHSAVSTFTIVKFSRNNISRTDRICARCFTTLPLFVFSTPVFRRIGRSSADSAILCRKDNLAFESWQPALRNQRINNIVLASHFERQNLLSSSSQADLTDAGSSCSIAPVLAQVLCSREKERDARTSALMAAELTDIIDASDTPVSLNTITAEFRTHSAPNGQAGSISFEKEYQSTSYVANSTPASACSRPSELTAILDKVKASGETKDLSCSTEENSTAVHAHPLAFVELGKTQMWSTLDSLLRAEIKQFDRAALCKIFNEIFEVCVTQDVAIWAGKWFCLMVQEGAQPDETTFTLLMPLFRRHHMLEDAILLHQCMIGLGFNWASASSSMALLHIHAGQHENAKQIYLKMLEANEELLPRIVIAELESFVGVGNAKQAEQLVKVLQVTGVKFDISVYNLMITINGKAGEHSRAKVWFQHIEEDGLTPNEATYRSIIGSCGRAGSLYDALQFYDRMVALNFSPNVVNYNTLIHLHRKVDHGGRIFALLSDMKLAGCIPNFATLNSLIKVYERYKRLEKLPEVLQCLREAGWQPNETCYGILIRAYIRGNMVDAAMETFRELCTAPKLEELLCYNLICICKSAGRYDEAIHVFNEMRAFKNVTPSFRTLGATLEAYCQRGAVNEAETIYKQLSSECEVDSEAYNAMLSMYSEAGMFLKAAEVLREFLQQKEKIEPTIDLCLSMLKVCTKCGLQEEAVELYWIIAKSKVVRTDNLYVGIIHCCARILPVHEVLELFKAMMAAKTPIDGMTCSILLDVFVKAGKYDEADHVQRLVETQ